MYSGVAACRTCTVNTRFFVCGGTGAVNGEFILFIKAKNFIVICILAYSVATRVQVNSSYYVPQLHLWCSMWTALPCSVCMKHKVSSLFCYQAVDIIS